MICVSLQWSGIRSSFWLSKYLWIQFGHEIQNCTARSQARGLLENRVSSWRLRFFFPFVAKRLTSYVPVEFVNKVSGIIQVLTLLLFLGRMRREHLSRGWFWIQAVDPHWRESEEVKSEHWLANATDSALRALSVISHGGGMLYADTATGFHFTLRVLASRRVQVRH